MDQILKDNKNEIKANAKVQNQNAGPGNPTLPSLVLTRKLNRPEMVFGLSESMNQSAKYFRSIFAANHMQSLFGQW